MVEFRLWWNNWVLFWWIGVFLLIIIVNFHLISVHLKLQFEFFYWFFFFSFIYGDEFYAHTFIKIRVSFIYFFVYLLIYKLLRICGSWNSNAAFEMYAIVKWYTMMIGLHLIKWTLIDNKSTPFYNLLPSWLGNELVIFNSVSIFLFFLFIWTN